MEHKNELETEIIRAKPIIVTTVGKACTRLLVEREFVRIVMDEATMIKENEAFLSAINAE